MMVDHLFKEGDRVKALVNEDETGREQDDLGGTHGIVEEVRPADGHTSGEDYLVQFDNGDAFWMWEKDIALV